MIAGGPRPIETVYRGCRFRSRLEARWAVFFDALGLRWEYEKEGFELPSGERYLPDFWIPGLTQAGSFVEIKPRGTDRDDLSRAFDLGAMVLEGLPWPNEYRIWSMHLLHDVGCEMFWAQFGRCRRCDNLYLAYGFNGEHWINGYRRITARFTNCRVCFGDTDREPLLGLDTGVLGEAYRAARGARFEFGESG
jgi:hypothetical protein